MIQTKAISEVMDMEVYTDAGIYLGDIEESVLANNKVYGWRIRATKRSYLNKVLGGAKGVVVPHQYVKSIGDIMIVDKSATPANNIEESDKDI